VVMNRQADDAMTQLQDCSLWCAMTDNGDNDTSVAFARSAEYPAMVRFQWRQFAAVRLLKAR